LHAVLFFKPLKEIQVNNGLVFRGAFVGIIDLEKIFGLRRGFFICPGIDFGLGLYTEREQQAEKQQE